jgi:hypothetical protein
MPRGKDFKRHVRARMSETGERYTQARERLRLVGGGAPGGQIAGWIISGSRSDAYEAAIMPLAGSGSRAASLRAVRDPGDGFGTLMQMLAAEDYRGKRLRFSASVKGEDVRNWSGLWMRVDGQRSQLEFDNMQDRPLHGTFEWTAAEIVLDAPSESEAVAFGLLLAGTGTVWLRDVRFEAVSGDAALEETAPRLRREPRNLDFSEQEATERTRGRPRATR